MDNNIPPSFGQPQLNKKANNGDREVKKSTRRVISTNRKIALTLAMVLAVLLVLFLAKAQNGKYVIVAKTNLQPLTSFSTGNLSIVSMPQGNIEPTAFSSSSVKALQDYIATKLTGSSNNVPLVQGEQLNNSVITVPLQPGEQLLSISAKSADAVVGKIKAGDYVDIWGGLQNGTISLIASNVQVYALGLTQDQLDTISNSVVSNPSANSNSLIPGAPLPGSYVLKVQTSDVPKYLALMDGSNLGVRIFFTLRSPNAAQTSTIQPLDAHDVICGNNTSSICARK